MSEVIVITSGKGGVGKTTTTANVGTGLAKEGKKVVLIHTDIGLRNLDVTDQLKDEFDYILLDCPAGIEQGFMNAIAGASRAIVVTTPEVSAVRDADRIIGLLNANEIKKTELVVNRLRYDMVKRGDMMSSDDVVEILAVDLLGVVPDDENIVVSTNQGEPLVGSKSLAGQAYENICKRIMGEEVPLLDLSKGTGFFSKIKSKFKNN